MAQTRSAPETGRSHERRSRNPARSDSTLRAPEQQLHPMLQLQQGVGNAAVEQLVAPGGEPATIQRHVSPATAATGMSNHASIMLHGAQLMTANQQLQMTAQQLTAIEQGVSQDAINTLIHNVQAESYPAAQPTPQQASGDEPGGTVTLGEPEIYSGGQRIH